MREHVNSASRRRDERLGRIRKLSLWITGGAAAASLGMGTAFAHAIPGHSTTTPGRAPATGTTGGSASGGSTTDNGSTTGNTSTTTQQGTAPSTTGHHRHRLAPPASAPSAAPAQPAAPAAPVVSSGGS